MTQFKLFCILMCLASFVRGHNFAPSLLELREQPGGVINLLWRTPLQALKQPIPVLPENCRRLGTLQQGISGSAAEIQYSVLCPSGAPLHFAITGLGESKTAALLRWHSVDGGYQQVLFHADSDSFSPKSELGLGRALLQFGELGVIHILAGADHLLFVLGLLMLAATLGRLVLLITSFTLGHSISLALVSLGYIPHLPTLAEWLIALSVLLMACYLSARGQQQTPRKGLAVLVAGFGLLHGLGFAGVLNTLLDGSAGLVAALLGFNIGIELGQLLFIAGVLLFAWLVRTLAGPQLLGVTRWAAIYLMGAVAMYWLIDRGLALTEAALVYGVY